MYTNEDSTLHRISVKDIQKPFLRPYVLLFYFIYVLRY
jgi:hypothetical protein